MCAGAGCFLSFITNPPGTGAEFSAAERVAIAQATQADMTLVSPIICMWTG